jgi:hypothetical protein
MTRRPPAALIALAAIAAVLFGLTASGTVPLPDLDQALTDLSDTLGTWTYALVGALAFVETGAFVGLIAPGETAVVLGGVVAAEGGVDHAPMLRIGCGSRRRPATSRASCSAGGSGGGSSSRAGRAWA